MIKKANEGFLYTRDGEEEEDQERAAGVDYWNSPDAFVVPYYRNDRNGAAIFEMIRGSGGSFELPFSPGSWHEPGLKGAF
jgi:hypothetical protein